MPEKDPQTWVHIMALFDSIPASIKGAIMATMMGILRVVYDKEETAKIRMFLEGAMCGGMTLSISSLLDYCGAPESLSIAVGGFIGCIGVNKVRMIAVRWIDKKVDK